MQYYYKYYKYIHKFLECHTQSSRGTMMTFIKCIICVSITNTVDVLFKWKRIFRSTSKSRPNNIRGGKNVRPYVRPSVRPSTKSFFDFNEIWYIGRGRWVMHDSMLYDQIQGQGQGHEPFKVWIPSIFKTYLLRHLQWELASDH